jgi:hypothetical protein
MKVIIALNEELNFNECKLRMGMNKPHCATGRVCCNSVLLSLYVRVCVCVVELNFIIMIHKASSVVICVQYLCELGFMTFYVKQRFIRHWIP